MKKKNCMCILFILLGGILFAQSTANTVCLPKNIVKIIRESDKKITIINSIDEPVNIIIYYNFTFKGKTTRKDKSMTIKSKEILKNYDLGNGCVYLDYEVFECKVIDPRWDSDSDSSNSSSSSSSKRSRDL
jgi:hypothetical protein